MHLGGFLALRKIAEALIDGRVSIPRQSRGIYDVRRSKRLERGR